MQTQKLTRQGVKDMNTKAINGKRPTCPHYQNPQMVAVERRKEERIVEAAHGGVVKVNVYYCANCGVERYTDTD